ncbi:hypothetical protein [Sphingomonas sp. OTU376]|uniref:hypothetical protein n=1 Tax=Sphingomonas sp. OTU376 TaxID=3043863 RepID=UPI00313AC59A
MRFERMFRLGMLAGVALAMPGLAMAAVPVAKAAAQAGPQSGPQSAEDYQWIDRADALWDAIGDSPPDFAFPFEGAEPWAWQTTDGYTIIVEDAGEGGIRSYYFAPGARGPFLAVEPGMSFAYESGRLAMVYDADGEATPRGEFGDYDDAAGDLYDRALRLRDAMSGRDYRPVDADVWIDTSPLIFSFIQSWDIGRSRYPGWARYHARSDAAAWRRRFDAEQRRRRDQALRFRHWRDGGFQGPPPGRFHRPDGPGRPGAGRPNQPGSGWSRPPGGGRPGRPGWGGRPGTTPDAPGGGTRPPVTRPDNFRPDGTPGWRRGRPSLPAPSDVAPDTPPAPDATRPPRPLPDGSGTGWRRPSQPGAGNPTWSRPSRPEGGWQRPNPPVVTPMPAPGAPSTGDATPSRPGWNRPSRPEGGWQRPNPPVVTPAPAPATPSTGDAAPSRPNWNRPARPEGGWSRPDRPEGGWQRPSAPSATPAPAPAAPPAADNAPSRPSWSRPSRPEGWQRPATPSAAPRPSYSPPPQAAPAPRPSYTPPPPRTASPPPPRSAPPRPAKLPDKNLSVD